MKKNELQSEFENREKTRAQQHAIQKKFEAQKRLARQVRHEQYPTELQELAKQFPIQSVDALIQFNDEIYMNEEMRSNLVSI